MRAAQNETWVPRCFELDPVTDSWHYRHADVRPWDQRNDVVQYESNFVIATKTRHRTPMIREASIVSVERQSESIRQQLALSSPNGASRKSGEPNTNGTGGVAIRRIRNVDGSISSSAEGDQLHSSEEDRPVVDNRQLRSGPIRYTLRYFRPLPPFLRLNPSLSFLYFVIAVGITCCSTWKTRTAKLRIN